MSDIFTIKMSEPEFQIGKKKHKICDPPFGSKNKQLKMWRELDKIKDTLNVPDWMEKQHAINCELIKQYLPTISNQELEKMGQAYCTVLIKHLLEQSEVLFGAVVQKVEKK